MRPTTSHTEDVHHRNAHRTAFKAKVMDQIRIDSNIINSK